MFLKEKKLVTSWNFSMSRHIALADLPVSAQELETRVSEITTQARKEGLNGAVTLTVIFSNFDGWRLNSRPFGRVMAFHS